MSETLTRDAIDQAPDVTADDVRDKTKPHAVVVTMSDVEEEPTHWLWWPYIALGTVCILDGDPGVGKTLLMTQLAASLSLGDPLPDQQGKPALPTGGPAPTLLLSIEDSLTRTLKKRLTTAGADCTQIHVLTAWNDGQGHEYVFTFDHLPFLEEALETYHPRLVVIDPVTAYMGKMDIHRANEVQALMAKLTRLAERADCAIVCIRHPAKPGQHIGKAIHRGLGSVGFIGSARTGLFAESHPTNPAKVLLGQSKSNMERCGRTQLFTKDKGQFQWCGVSRISAEMMAGSGRGPDPIAFLEALFWLEARLDDHLAWPATDLQEEAAAEGISHKVLLLASRRLQVVKRQQVLDDDSTEKRKTAWTWQIPPLPLLSPPTIGLSDDTESTESTGSSGYYGFVSGDKPSSTPPTQENTVNPERPEYPEDIIVSRDLPPCAVCQGVDRWDDHGTTRCLACYPPASKETP